ncbi:MAG: ChaN family lipoprotein [Gemmatimonadota bacterium]
MMRSEFFPRMRSRPRTSAWLAAAALLAGVLAAPGGAQERSGGADVSDSLVHVVEGVDFQVYDGRGRMRSFAHILSAADDADVILVGEEHDDRVGHGVEAQLFMRAAERYGATGGPEKARRPVVLSLEMFEADVQYILDEYLQGFITESQFKKSARPWERYDTDYRPMVEFARAHDIPVIAANAPRRYVNRVTRKGPSSLEQLPETARSLLPPLPFPVPSDRYKAQWDSLMGSMQTEGEGGGPPRHGMGYALYSQALWDAAMGYSVARTLDAYPGALVIHYAGSFHVERGTGIPERVRDYRPGTRILTVVMQPSDDIFEWKNEEYRDYGDFVILTRAPVEKKGEERAAQPR